jgi:uncharacterized membrane protein YfcA
MPYLLVYGPADLRTIVSTSTSEMASLDLLHGTALIIAGCIAGLMNSIAGGGTLVTFPTLIVVGIPSIPANATSTIALLPAAIASAVGYRNKIRTVSRWLRLFAPVSLLGGLLGGILLVRTPTRIFDWLVPFLILFATVLFMAHSSFTRFFGAHAAKDHTAPPSRIWLLGGAAFQFCVAVYGGYFGAGIGILMLASLGMIGFKDVHEMNALKVILGFLINVVAAVYFISSGLVQWPAAGVTACGTIIGGFAGAHFAQKVPQQRVRMLITGIGLIISAIMFYRQFS